MRAVSLEEVSQGHRAVRRPAGMLALHCSPVALDKAPMARYGQAKQGIRPDLEVGLSPVVTRDGRDLPAGAILCGELAATRFAVGGAERPGRNGLRRWRHPSWLGGDRALRSRQTTSTFRIPAGLASIASECVPRSDCPDLTGLLSERAPKSGQRGSTAPQCQAVKGWTSFPPPAQRTGLSERVEAAVPIQHGNLRPIQHTEICLLQEEYLG
jgi:hypothetical protein